MKTQYALYLSLKVLLFCGLAPSVMAQQPIPGAGAETYAWFDFHTSYAFGFNTEVYGQESTSDINGFNLKNVYGSYGSGIHLGLDAGYYLTDVWAISAGFNHVFGSTTTINSTDEFFGSTQETTEEFSANHNSIAIKGNYVKMCETNPFTYSIGCGPLFAFGGMKTYNLNYTTNDAFQETRLQSVEKYKLKPGLGIASHVSVMYNLSDQLSIGAEMNFNSFGLKFKSSEVTEYSQQNIDPSTGAVITQINLSDLPDEQVFTEYTDELDDSMVPGMGYSYQLNQRTTFSSVGFGIRAQYKINRDR